MKYEDLDFVEDLKLDQHGLDFEWLRQASLFQQYAVLYADLASFRDEAKEDLQRIDGEIFLDVRENYGKYDLDTKPTEATIKSVVLLDPDHIAAFKKYNEANRRMMIVQGAKTALEHKKSALERLSALYMSGYWADPKITAEAKDHYQNDCQSAHRSQLANNERIGGKDG